MEPTEEGDWGRIAIMMALAFALVGISVYIRYSYGINLNFPRPQWFHSFFGTVGAITFGFALRMMLVKSRGNQNV